MAQPPIEAFQIRTNVAGGILELDGSGNIPSEFLGNTATLTGSPPKLSTDFLETDVANGVPRLNGSGTLDRSKLGFKPVATVNLTSDQTRNALEDIIWDDNQLNAGVWHSIVTNPERLTVPSGFGISVVQLFAQVRFTGPIPTDPGLIILKNGVGGFAGNGRVEYIGNPQAIQVFTNPISVVSGDFFTLQLEFGGSPSSATLQSGSPATWMGIVALG